MTLYSHAAGLRLRQWIKTAAMAATAQVGESPLFLFDYLIRLMRVAVLLALWRTLLGGQQTAGGFTLAALLTYTLIAEALAEPLAARTELFWALWQGTITTRWLQPMGLYAQFAAEALGRWSIGLALFSVPLWLAAPLLGVDPRPASLQAGLWFVPSLVLAVTVGLGFDFLLGAVMVGWQLNLWAVQHMRGALLALLSGALIPLSLLPWGLGEVFAWLPFAAMAYAPLRVYTGTGAPLPLLAMQIVWAVLLWTLSSALWHRYQEKMVSYGG